ncbi:indole-3-acetaldehyde oxidase-like [Micractinium conductrix]|uniref:Indole-3-acetaldehyde oxidase-like n=1 Tax=Micractinium conductrix TaxID=554055 RepID=A0A2P6VHQ6_9CHLO|nr:indole-3-acetaldehyde oxidase-like [Micractinium conductrix]|eukprot:PSC73608.1 indole-3-acetaldehyde oxidase-like [Micractinium conductrix]
MAAIVINGQEFGLEGVEPSTRLASFVRQTACDKSVRVACGSGLCGSCAVLATPPDGGEPRALNSCLTPVGSMAGWSVSTAAGLGCSARSHHPVQERVAAFHASQCGFCTPGFVVGLGAGLERAAAAGRQPAAAELAACIDGNLCRCTGFRPLMDVCKSLAGGADIEDLGLHSAYSPCSPEAPPPARPTSAGAARKGPLRLQAGGRTWLAPRSLQELLQACADAGTSDGGGDGGDGGGPVPRFVAGNTGSGLFPQLWPSDCPLVITLGGVEEMRTVTEAEGSLVVGAAVTIAELIATLEARVPGGSPTPGGAATDNGLANGGGTADAASVDDGTAASAAGGAAPTPPPPHPCAALAGLLARVAGAHVRAAGTVGGNLMLAREQGLESDVATGLLGWGASVVLLNTSSEAAAAAANNAAGGVHATNGKNGAAVGAPEVPLEDFLGDDGSPGAGRLLVAVRLPLPAEGAYYWTSKVAPAHSSVHATMNAAVGLRFASGSGGSAHGAAVADASVALGYYGANRWAVHRAAAAEAALMGRQLSPASLAAALKAVVADVAGAARPSAAAAMAQGLMLQALVPRLAGAAGGADDGGEGPLPPALRRLLRVPAPNQAPPVMRGRQEFEEAPEGAAPLGAPMEKDRVLLQTSGEAQYTGDVPLPAGAQHAAWVTASEACATVEGIDAAAALAAPGVVAFICAADLPEGRNSVAFPMGASEPLFASEQVEYHSQPLGLIVATSQEAAKRGAALVRVAYGPPPEPPVLSLAEARRRSSYYKMPPPIAPADQVEGDPEGALAAAPRAIRGRRVAVPANYHLYLETQSALALPDEGGAMKVWSAAQDIGMVQKAVATALGKRHHEVEAVCRRVGGAFGGKCTRNLPVAVAAALAAAKTGRAVRFVQDRQTDMRLMGGHCEALAEFDCGFTEEGEIQSLSLEVFLLLGAFPDVPLDGMNLASMITMAYSIPNLSLKVRLCRSNTAPTTFMRAPGDAQAALIMESVVEQVAAACGLDAALVRERNFAEPAESGGVVRLALKKEVPAADYTLPRLWARLKESAGYEARCAEVAAFNLSNPWVKRGLGMTHTRFDCGVPAKPAYVSLFTDGSVLVQAGGSEVGQGLTTKVKQAALSELSQLLPEARRPLPAELVRIADQTTNVLPAGNLTGGSTTSEAACHGVKQACGVLRERLAPFAADLGPEGTWGQLMAAVAKANGLSGCQKVPLTAVGYSAELEGGCDARYTVWGAACTEAEVNILTGERRLLRTDCVMDCGRSLNPAVDVGQVEGALAQGLGMVLSEERRMCAATGRLLTDSLWHYHAPTAAAMPRQLNVCLLPGSRLERSTLSAKAVGEPPLMLAASALSALQAAVRAGRAELAALGASSGGPSSGGASSNGGGGEDGSERLASGGCEGSDGDASLLQLPASVDHVMAALCGARGRDLAAAVRAAASDAR